MTNDIERIQNVPQIDMLMAFVQRITNLRISLIARVESSTWTCLAVRDDAGFGLDVGDTLDVATTY